MDNTLAKRIAEIEQTFNTQQAEREQHLKAAEECLTEMTKAQGAYAELVKLQEGIEVPEAVKPTVKVKDEGKKHD